MTNFKNLKVGDKLSETQFYIVDKIVGNQVQLRPDKGETIVVDAGYAENFLTSASEFTTTQNITRTEAVELVRNHPFTAMTINYNKQAKEADIVKEIQDAYDNSTPKEFSTKIKAAVKKSANGEERTIVGRHYNTYDGFGRLSFIDMDIAQDASKSYDVRNRLVDPRTINWLILKGVKYVTK